jgi:hypothetical protein
MERSFDQISHFFVLVSVNGPNSTARRAAHRVDIRSGQFQNDFRKEE